MKISEHFELQEFVSKDIYTKWRDKSIWFIRPEIIKLAEFYREYFDAPVTINNWHINGSFNYRGFREPECKIGAHLSQHRFGNAFDCNIKGLTPDEVRDSIIKNSPRFMEAGLTTLEDGSIAKTWVHSDCRTTNSNYIFIVLP